MREFFKPWRRKIGCATLLLAIGFVAIWIRNQSTTDTLEYGPVKEIKLDFGPDIGEAKIKEWAGEKAAWTFCKDGILWSRGQHSGLQSAPEFMNFTYRLSDKTPIQLPDPNGEFCQADWHWQWCGFQFGKYYLGRHFNIGSRDAFESHGHDVIWRFPHWAIAAPLTLLSTWLLLSKQESQRRPSAR